ncbi:alpha-1,3-mannosyl-glycoprotein 4-beta-N-acetylglucosaminyltransferase A-like [Palaemon carinicauda]|uniref:alpha-1,3-mannosyl-glycoprotein 4-beta-N-acetylglucosaminyltransferase A-like n=1 Tax=Palaemon carinicauda TaxID=392227 RepID=UPI0035B5A998
MRRVTCSAYQDPSVGRMLRRRLGVVFTAALLTPAFVLFFINSPDLSGEQELVQQIAELRERLHHAEMLNQDRLHDVIVLSQKFNILTQAGVGNLTNGRGPVLSQETRELLANLSHTPDLHLPSIYSYLPHLLHTPDATTPAFKLSKGRHSGDQEIQIPGDSNLDESDDQGIGNTVGTKRKMRTTHDTTKDHYLQNAVDNYQATIALGPERFLIDFPLMNNLKEFHDDGTQLKQRSLYN